MRAEPLLSLAAQVAGEHRANDVLNGTVGGLAAQPGVRWRASGCCRLAIFVIRIVSYAQNAPIRRNVFTWPPVPEPPRTGRRTGRCCREVSRRIPKRGRAAALGLAASTLDSKIKALKIDKRRYQNP